jgi:hypothetical protein
MFLLPQPILMRGLRAPSEHVRELAINELAKCCQRDEYMALMSLSDLLPLTLDCLSDESMSIATKASNILLKACYGSCVPNGPWNF